MGRLAREISSTGLYHIVFRGINKQHIFEDETDYKKMTGILKELKNELKFEIYAYCFMSNHVHLLLKEEKAGDISQFMKRLLTKYAMWFNKKYQRSGALIANRYKSQPVEIDEYFLSVVRYIHQNPIKGGLAENIKSYRWSSYKDYINNKKSLVDIDLVHGMINSREFEEFHKVEETEIFSVNDKLKITDEAIRRAIIKAHKIEPFRLGSMEKTARNAILCELKKEYSIRQIERVTGISRGVIAKC